MAAGGYAERPAGTLGTLRLQTTGLLSAFNKSGAPDPAGEAAQIAMDASCRWRWCAGCSARPAPASTPAVPSAGAGGRPGPATSISDHDLVAADPPGAGRPRRSPGRATARSGPGCVASTASHVSGKRVLRLLRPEGLLAPQRVRGRRKPRPHDGTIIPDRPNLRWGTDATMAWTRVDGWVWVFVCVDHYTAEAWAHVAKVGDRFAALQPVYDAVIDRWGRLDADVARGLQLRHDWGPQYRSAHFTGSLAWLGISRRPGVPG